MCDSFVCKRVLTALVAKNWNLAKFSSADVDLIDGELSKMIFVELVQGTIWNDWFGPVVVHSSLQLLFSD